MIVRPLRGLVLAASLFTGAFPATLFAQQPAQSPAPTVPASEYDPAVRTSDTVPAAAVPTPAPPVSPAAAPARAAPIPAPAGAVPSMAGRPATRTRNVMDRVELEASQITGNRELPRVLYIVPWKRSDLGDLAGKPVNSLLDEVLAPVDRDVFKRETRYFDALQRSNATDVTPGGGSAVAPAETPAASPEK